MILILEIKQQQRQRRLLAREAARRPSGVTGRHGALLGVRGTTAAAVPPLPGVRCLLPHCAHHAAPRRQCVFLHEHSSRGISVTLNDFQ